MVLFVFIHIVHTYISVYLSVYGQLGRNENQRKNQNTSTVLKFKIHFSSNYFGLFTDPKHCRRDEDVYGFPSSSYLQALQALSKRGHISSIMGCIGPLDPNDPNADPNLSEPGSQELFEGAVALCVSLATTREGGVILLENGFLSRVCALQFFRTPPPSAEEISPFGKNGIDLREEAVQLMESRLSPILRVMRYSSLRRVRPYISLLLLFIFISLSDLLC